MHKARAAILMAQELSLTASMAAAGVCRLLPERDACPRIHDGLESLLEDMAKGESRWMLRFVLWELELLRELGYGLELDVCALGGAREDIGYVSPRSGRGVSIKAGAEYAERLLTLPRFLRPESALEALAEDVPIAVEEIVAGLRLSGHFLERHGFRAHECGLPRARLRLCELLERDGNGATQSP